GDWGGGNGVGGGKSLGGKRKGIPGEKKSPPPPVVFGGHNGPGAAKGRVLGPAVQQGAARPAAAVWVLSYAAQERCGPLTFCAAGRPRRSASAFNARRSTSHSSLSTMRAQSAIRCSLSSRAAANSHKVRRASGACVQIVESAIILSSSTTERPSCANQRAAK